MHCTAPVSRPVSIPACSISQGAPLLLAPYKLERMVVLSYSQDRRAGGRLIVATILRSSSKEPFDFEAPLLAADGSRARGAPRALDA